MTKTGMTEAITEAKQDLEYARANELTTVIPYLERWLDKLESRAKA